MVGDTCPAFGFQGAAAQMEFVNPNWAASLENYFLPGDPKGQIGRFIEQYNHRRYHETLVNFTPADVYFGQGQASINRR